MMENEKEEEFDLESFGYSPDEDENKEKIEPSETESDKEESQSNNSQQTKPPITIGEPEIVSTDDSSNRLGARDKTAGSPSGEDDDYNKYCEQVEEPISKKEYEKFKLKINESKEALKEFIKLTSKKEVIEENSIEKEEEEDIEEKPKTEKEKQKVLHKELRNLLKDYPMKVEFNESIDETKDLVRNLILINDLLYYAKYHTSKEEIYKSINGKIKHLNNLVDINILRRKWLEYNNSNLNYGRSEIIDELNKILEGKFNQISDLVHYYSLVIPKKDKKNMHLSTAHGFPSALADDYEQEQNELAEQINDDTTFKVEEGKVIPIN